MYLFDTYWLLTGMTAASDWCGQPDEEQMGRSSFRLEEENIEISSISYIQQPFAENQDVFTPRYI
jgi:hypothetical protein